MEITPADVEGLFDTTCPFGKQKVLLVEALVRHMYAGSGPQEQGMAHQVLNRLQQHSESWRLAGPILQHTSDPWTQYLALRLLENAINTAWLGLPPAEREGIKQYVTNMAVEAAKSKDSQHKFLTNKINETLVQIVKREWPQHWPTFIQDLCRAAKTDSGLCKNALAILALLAEEILDFGNQMIRRKSDLLQAALTSDLPIVYELCRFVLGAAAQQIQAGTPVRSLDTSLCKAALDCLGRFVKAMPPHFIFQTDLLPLLMTYFFDPQSFRLDTLKIFVELVNLPDLAPESLSALQLNVWVPVVRYVVGMDRELLQYATKCHVTTRPFYEAFWAHMVLFLTSTMRLHMSTICEPPCEGNEQGQLVVAALEISIELTNEMHSDGSFKILVEFWNAFAEQLVADVQQGFLAATGAAGVGLPIEDPVKYSQRLAFYFPLLEKLRRVFILRMAKPQEVLLIFDEDTGSVEKETQIDTEEVELYTLMRETLVYLTNAGGADMMSDMLTVMSGFMLEAKQQSWNPTGLSRLCWAIGSISGAMDANREKTFLVKVILELLDLCEHKRGKDVKAIIVSMILYVFGQYPRFLRTYPRFLNVVIDKLVEFAHDTFPGVQEMTCETFLKVSMKCGDSIATFSQPGAVPLMARLSTQVPKLYGMLTSTKQQLMLMEAYGYCVAGHPDMVQRTNLLGTVLTPFLTQWQANALAIGMRSADAFTLDSARRATEILRCCERLAYATGFSFATVLSAMLGELRSVYMAYSNFIVNEANMKGQQQLGYLHIRAMRAVKRATVLLIDTFVEASTRPGVEREGAQQHIVQHVLPGVLETVLEDYKALHPKLREHEVLGLLETLTKSLGRNLLPHLPAIFHLTFDCTLDMIKADFHSFPDHRTKFYDFLKACVSTCSPDFLLQLTVEQRLAVVDSLAWAFQHEQPATAESGLIITTKLFASLEAAGKEAVESFCTTFYWKFLMSILDVTTDTLHKAGFRYHTLILMHLIQLVETGIVNLPNAGITKEEVSRRVAEALLNNFATLNRTQVEAFVVGMFNRSTDPKLFAQHLRDLLVQVRELSGTEEFFLQEREDALKEERELLLRKQQNIPGLVPQYKPLEMTRLEDLE